MNTKSWDFYVRTCEKRRMQLWQMQESSQYVHFFKTKDDWELALSSYTPKEKVSKPYPVLLCHGLGSNRLAYNLDKAHSLSLHLVEQGYDVYAIDLRGHGLSEKPDVGNSNKKWDWGFNEYAYEDLPAAINEVLKLSGKDKLHYIGHSMGGILLYCLQALRQNLPIQSGMTIGSTLNYHKSKTIYNYIVKLKPLTAVIKRAPIHLTALFSGYMTQFSRMFIDPMYACGENVKTINYRKLMANAMQPTTAKVLAELARAINGEGMQTRDGKKYADLLQKQGYSFPTLAIAGSKDTQCSPEAASRFGTDWQSFGKKYGHRTDYGHMDLISGEHSCNEVWPSIVHWLDSHNQAISKQQHKGKRSRPAKQSK